jgi:hypothetical protein
MKADEQKNQLDATMENLKAAIKKQLDRIYDEKVRLIDNPVKDLRAATDAFTDATQEARQRAMLPPRATSLPPRATSPQKESFLASASRDLLGAMGPLGEATPQTSPAQTRVVTDQESIEFEEEVDSPERVDEPSASTVVVEPSASTVVVNDKILGAAEKKPRMTSARLAEKEAKQKNQTDLGKRSRTQNPNSFGPARNEGTQPTGSFIMKKGGALVLPPFY